MPGYCIGLLYNFPGILQVFQEFNRIERTGLSSIIRFLRVDRAVHPYLKYDILNTHDNVTIMIVDIMVVLASLCKFVGYNGNDDH